MSCTTERTRAHTQAVRRNLSPSVISVQVANAAAETCVPSTHLSLLTVSETEYEADSADDGATDNATDNESDTDSDYDSLPSLLTESTRYSPARNLCTRDLCTPCTHTRHGELARAVCPQGPHQHPPHPPRSPRLPYTPRVSNCVFRLCMCRSVSANTVVVLSPGDDGVYNTDDDLNDGWVLVEFNGNSGFVLCRSRGH